MKYIFVTGGVVSGLGKGSQQHLGRLSKRGIRVTMQSLTLISTLTPEP